MVATGIAPPKRSIVIWIAADVRSVPRERRRCGIQAEVKQEGRTAVMDVALGHRPDEEPPSSGREGLRLTYLLSSFNCGSASASPGASKPTSE